MKLRLISNIRLFLISMIPQIFGWMSPSYLTSLSRHDSGREGGRSDRYTERMIRKEERKVENTEGAREERRGGKWERTNERMKERSDLAESRKTKKKELRDVIKG